MGNAHRLRTVHDLVLAAILCNASTESHQIWTTKLHSFETRNAVRSHVQQLFYGDYNKAEEQQLQWQLQLCECLEMHQHSLNACKMVDIYNERVHLCHSLVH